MLDQRRREKKEMLQTVKKYSKGKTLCRCHGNLVFSGRGEKPNFLRREEDDDEFPTTVVPARRGPPGLKSKKRQGKVTKGN